MYRSVYSLNNFVYNRNIIISYNKMHSNIVSNSEKQTHTIKSNLQFAQKQTFTINKIKS